MLVLPLLLSGLVGASGYLVMLHSREAFLPLDAHSSEVEQIGAAASVTIKILSYSIIALFIGLALCYGLTLPLNDLLKKVKDAATGNLAAKVELQSGQEVNSLAAAFNQMLLSVNKYILEGLTGAAIIVSMKGTITSINPVAEAILGCDADEVTGKHFTVLFGPGENEEISRVIGKALAELQPYTGTVSFTKRGGQRIEADLSVSFLKDEGESMLGLIIKIKDTGEMNRLREQFRRADQLAVLGFLAASVAHEIRNPLGSIQGLVELLGEEFPEGDARRGYIDAIMKSIGRMNNIVEELLVASGPLAFEPLPCNLNELVREALHLARRELGDKRIEIVERYQADLPSVPGSADKLLQAFLNIVRNGLEAAPEGGRFSVSTASGEGKALVRFANTGSYISEEDLHRLFAPFYTTKSRGTGLGLYIAKLIVDAHSGAIIVESKLNEETSFTVELPLAKAHCS